MTQQRSPIRILHVLYGMDCGGIESWLMHVLRHIDRTRFQTDFLLSTAEPGRYDDEIRSLGSRIISCLRTEQPLTYAQNLKRALVQFGPYDFIHTHFQHYAGWVLRTAHHVGIPNRIAHSHSDTRMLQARAKLYRKLYLMMTRRWVKRHATAGLACSEGAASGLYGRFWQHDSRWKIHYCGIDCRPFRARVNSRLVRSELGIPANAFVIGHVGRFDTAKNHLFLLDILHEVIKRQPKARLLLVGDGPLRPEVEAKAQRLGMEKYITFAGVRSDIPRLMLAAIDIFVFPSLFEGLPLVLIEAQGAGLPSILSETVPQETDVVKPLLHRISLSEPASVWAKTLLEVQKTAATITQADALAMIEASPFNIIHSVRNLENFYHSKMLKA
jgi:glycosyltransferase involved in cell wall biosynthesis